MTDFERSSFDSHSIMRTLPDVLHNHQHHSHDHKNDILSRGDFQAATALYGGAGQPSQVQGIVGWFGNQLRLDVRCCVLACLEA